MLVSLTVGKVDAGVAVLLTHDNRLIEFPSVLLPKNITSGSIVDITVSRNQTAENANISAFQSLQKRILHTYGINSPSPPVLRLKNATQTSLVLEWDPINLATASLKSLSLYRNDSKAGPIPRPLEMLSTKISGLAIDTEYSFYLILRTSAGTLNSEKLVCRTHKMTDLSGITVTPGILPGNLKSALTDAVERIGAKMADTVRIDTTHFVCTEGRGAAWEKAVEMNIPVVRPEWVEGCEREGTIVSVRGYYLNADPKLRQIGPGVGAQQNRQHAVLNSSESTEQKQDRPSLSQNSSQSKGEQVPITPFPGGPTSQPPNGLRPEEGDTPASPPPPPPKDDDKAPSSSPHSSEVDGDGDNDNHKVEEEKSDQPADEDEPSEGESNSDSEKTPNGHLETEPSVSQNDSEKSGKQSQPSDPSSSPSPNPSPVSSPTKSKHDAPKAKGATAEETELEEVAL